MGLLLLTLLHAGPVEGSNWKVELRARERLEGSARLKGKLQSQGGDFVLQLALTAHIAKVADARADVVDLESNDGPPALTLRHDSGAAVLIPVTPKGAKREKLEPQLASTLRKFLGRMVLTDPDRAEMSSCGEGHREATERWLLRLVTEFEDAQPGEFVLSNATVRCARAGAGVKHAVAFTATATGGMTRTLKLQGTVMVDPAVWVTQWSLAGSRSMEGDSSVGLRIKGHTELSLRLRPAR